MRQRKFGGPKLGVLEDILIKTIDNNTKYNLVQMDLTEFFESLENNKQRELSLIDGGNYGRNYGYGYAASR